MTKLVANQLDFKSARIRNDPWSYFGELRDQGELIRIGIPLIGKSWAVTTYAGVNEVFKDTERFVRDPRNAGRRTYAKIQWLMPRVFNSLVHNMLGADGQRHRRLRSIVDQAFAMRNVEGMSERIAELSQEQLAVAAQAVGRDGKFDLLQHFARPFPLTVICELLGLPLEDRPKFREWFEPMSSVSSAWGIFRLTSGMKKVVKYLRHQFDVVRENPRDGLMSSLVQIEHEGETLNEDELLSMVFLLLVAGHETTVHLISNAVFTLLQQPSAKLELLDDWSKSAATIEEVLRYASPLQMGKPRYVAVDTEFLGQRLKRGEMITPLIASANYDPLRFENPDQFDIQRERIYHMSFGSGPHVCLGMKLARVETEHALKSLFGRWPDLTPGFDLSHPDWSKRLGTRGFKTMILKT